MAHRVEDLRLRLIAPRTSAVLIDGVQRSAVFPKTTVAVAQDLLAELVFDAGTHVIAESIDDLGLDPGAALDRALHQTLETTPAHAEPAPLRGLPDNLWVLRGEAPYVTAAALVANRYFADPSSGRRPPAVIVGVPRRTEVFCYPVAVENLPHAQPMAEAIARFSVGYFRETEGAISPHVYWNDGTKLHTLLDTTRRESFPSAFVQHVLASAARA